MLSTFDSVFLSGSVKCDGFLGERMSDWAHNFEINDLTVENHSPVFQYHLGRM